MTERQAIQEGLNYTGMAFSRWDREKAEKYAKKVADLKKKYKCRAVKVLESSGYYCYYGDENFCKVQYDDEETCQKMIDSVPRRMAELRKEYEEKLKNLEAWKQEWVDKKNAIEAIRK